MDRLHQAARNCLRVNMGLKRTETVLIVTDTGKEKIAKAFFQESEKLAKETIMMVMTPREMHGQEPPKLVAEAMKRCDVLMIPTSKSLSHTRARKAARLKGVRIASMPNITEDMIKRTFNTDYRLIKRRGIKLCNLFDKGKVVRLTAPAGTDITIGINGRKGLGRAGGMYDTPDGWGNMPAGEAFIAPVEGTSEGVFVIDTSSPLGTGMLTKPISVTVKKGMAVRIEGGKQARELDAALRKVGRLAYNIAELGIGTNPAAKITGNILEDEKVFGTAHIALGNSKSFGGKVDVPIHLDGVFLKPTIWIDDKKIMERGKLIV